MTPQWAVVLIHEDADGESWGPFRSLARARQVFDAVADVYGDSGSDVRLERLAPWPGKRAFRGEHDADDA